MTDEHDKWCRDQHEKNQKNTAKIFTRLGAMDVHIKEHATCAAEVREELKVLNKLANDLKAWTSKRDGATKALMWAAGISGTVLAVVTGILKLNGL